MKLLHNIGERLNSNYNTREEILACDDELSFDGIYHNVFRNNDVLRGKKVTLFVMGAYVGGDNSFDAGMPLEKYCSWDEVIALADTLRAEIGWHTWTHRDLTTLSDEELAREVQPPFPMKAFAYPHGRFDDRVIAAVKSAGYERAYGVFNGDGSPYQMTRSYLNW